MKFNNMANNMDFLFRIPVPSHRSQTFKTLIMRLLRKNPLCFVLMLKLKFWVAGQPTIYYLYFLSPKMCNTDYNDLLTFDKVQFLRYDSFRFSII